MRTGTRTALVGLLIGLPVLGTCRGGSATTITPAGPPTTRTGGMAGQAGQAPSAADPVTFEARVSHPVALAGGPQDVYVHLALRAAELPRVSRLGLNLALVIDRSGSMGTEDKLRFAKSAAEQLVGRLRAEDQLSIVAYDDEITTLMASAPVRNGDGFRSAIRQLAPGGSTDLHGGLVAGADEVLGHFDGERLNRVLLISDGLANEGVTDPFEIRRRATAYRERGVQVSTMGMGLEYDEDLLSGIAQEAGGTYYYVDAAESVGRHLDREIDQLAQVVARDPEFRVELGAGVESVELFGYAHRREGDALVIPMSDIVSGEERKVVLRLRVRGSAGAALALAGSRLEYRAASDGERHALERPALEVVLSDDPAEVERARDLEVLVKAEVVRNAIALDEAMRLQRQGLFDEAQELLAARYRNSKTFNDVELRSSEVTRILNRMKEVMLDLERTRSDPRGRRDLQLTTQLRALGYAQ